MNYNIVICLRKVIITVIFLDQCSRGSSARIYPGATVILIYISDLADDLSSNVKLFAGDTSLFSVVHDGSAFARELNDDLRKINKWAFHWKMSFNPDPNEQAQEVIFSRKIKKLPHPSLVFNNNNVLKASSQKHLGVILDVKI